MRIHFEYTGFEQQMRINDACFVPKIYDGEGDPPSGFNGVRIHLDASDCSSLDWQAAILKAQYHITQGFLILWDLQFALLEGSLDDDVRFMTLQLGVQHFVDVIWPLFKEQTLGISLYRGVFTEELKEMVEYLKGLAALLPEEALCLIFLDTSHITEPGSYFRLMAQDAFGCMRLAVKGPCCERFPYAFPSFAWGHGSSPLGFFAERCATALLQRRIEYAICLPEAWGEPAIKEAIESLGEKPFRVIPEALLTQEWDGIEKLIIFPECLHERGLRKIKGFQASGGEILIRHLA